MLRVTQLARNGTRIRTCRQEAKAWPAFSLSLSFTVSKRPAEVLAHLITQPQNPLGLSSSCSHADLAPGFSLSSGELPRQPFLSLEVSVLSPPRVPEGNLRGRDIPGPSPGNASFPPRDAQLLSAPLDLKAALVLSRLGLANKSPCCAVD